MKLKELEKKASFSGFDREEGTKIILQFLEAMKPVIASYDLVKKRGEGDLKPFQHLSNSVGIAIEIMEKDLK